MYVVHSYSLAVVFCVITMLCWGSWANSRKLAAADWRFELFYWDYAIGVLLITLVLGATIGTLSNGGPRFLPDLLQADRASICHALFGGAVFNLANILLVAAIEVAGMAVAFPVGIGLALVLGVILNYVAVPVGNPALLGVGVALVTLAIILDALAYRRQASAAVRMSAKGLVLSLACGVFMGVFYRFVAASMYADPAHPIPGLMGSYAAVFVFAIGVFLSNFLWNTLAMKFPVMGAPVPFSHYLRGRFNTHLAGIFGGVVWGIGISLNLIASGRAGYAISYGLGQGATLVAALWGVFVWKEFRGARGGVTGLLAAMFLCFIAGLALIILARTA
ncbi:MAG TPA: GRP family sugar transporter [Steroidobacteraceae bacterium]|jgi:glucose uptake protein|nr:GRP family sugar transporter [Steroidobacteraceae bacterium]